MDDDIQIEPESILRLIAFADRCTRPTMVGGHMFDLHNRTVLHTFGEIVDPYRIQPAVPHPDQTLGHDFAESNLRTTRWLHRRVDVDYNGWWMTLIPTDVIREIGLSLPIFIKWDDAEYGLRAKAAGIPTVSLPGAAVWHVSWVDKDDLVGWQAFFHERNRMIVALLHSVYTRGGRVIRESAYNDVKHLVSMQHYTQEGRLLALRDLLEGPDRLHERLGTRLPRIRARALEFSDADYRSDVESYPRPRPGKPPRKGRGFARPGAGSLVPWAAKTLTRQLALRPRAANRFAPQAVIPHQDAKWWVLSQYDSALVSNADGSGAAWFKRDPSLVRAQLLEAGRLHATLFARWDRLRDVYTRALPEITSFAAWEKTFAANPAAPRRT